MCIMEAIVKQTCEEHFGTAYETYKQSVKQYSPIRLQYVKSYLDKRDGIQVKSKPKTYNSCVSPGSQFEFEIDIMDMESNGLVAICNFIKTAEVRSHHYK